MSINNSSDVGSKWNNWAAIMLTLFLCALLFACSLHKKPYNNLHNKQHNNDKYVIVIDPGHGGHDLGEVTSDGNMTEKEINLIKAKRLADYINRNSRFEAILTRDNDEFIALDERGVFPNMNNADIFVSLHTTFQKNRNRNEIVTYYLGIPSDEFSIRSAVNANGSSKQNLHDLSAIISSLIDEDLKDKSSRLSRCLHQSIFANIFHNRYYKIKNGGIKTAPLYVLLAAKMPSVLIETSHFVDSMNNRGHECLPNWDYICKGLLKGIELYIQKEEAKCERHGANKPFGKEQSE